MSRAIRTTVLTATLALVTSSLLAATSEPAGGATPAVDLPAKNGLPLDMPVSGAGVRTVVPQTSHVRKQAQANVIVRLTAPAGVNGSVSLIGPSKVTVIQPPNTKVTVEHLRIKPGSYRVRASKAMHKDHWQIPKMSMRKIVVPKKGVVRLAATWQKRNESPPIEPLKVSVERVKLGWESNRKVREIVVRRALGSTPPTSRTEGTKITAGGAKSRGAKDASVKVGKTYSYALFARTDRGWREPSETTVHISEGGQSVTRPGALVIDELAPDAFSRLSASEATLHLPKGQELPPLGVGVLLPAGPQLPSGMVASVTGHLPNHTVQLGPGSLTDVFSYLDMRVDLAKVRATGVRARADRRVRDVGSCASDDGSFQASDIQVSMAGQLRGQYRLEIRKGWLETPAGADIHAELAFRPEVTANIESLRAGSCSAKLPTIGRSIEAELPLAMTFEPRVTLAADARASISQATAAVDFGVGAKASLGADAVAPKAWPLLTDPTISVAPKLDRAVSMKLGGRLEFGVGSLGDPTTSGTVVGLSGEVDVADTRLRAAGMNNWSQPCFTADASSAADLTLTAKAFVPHAPDVAGWSDQVAWPLPFDPKTDGKWAGYPQTRPAGCDAAVPPTPSPTPTPTPEPTEVPTLLPQPTSAPTTEPTTEPTSEPTSEPTAEPTPTEEPPFTTCAEQTKIPEIECEALFKIREANADDWWGYYVWGTGHPCGWPGIACANGHVEGLGDQNLSYIPRIPLEATNLTHLKSVYLSGLMEPLPEGLTSIPTLEEFTYQYPEGAGLPVGLEQLTNVGKLDLSNTPLGEVPPAVLTFTNLTELRLTNAGLKAIPPEIGNLDKLETLVLDRNPGLSLPEEIGNLSRLSWLEAGASAMTTLPAGLGRLTNLTYLHLADNNLTALPASLSNLSNVEYLYLGANPMDAFPEAIGGMTGLIGLDLSYSQIADLPPIILNLTKLELLDYTYTPIATVPPHLGRLTSLVGVSFMHTPVDSLPSEFYNLTNMQLLFLNHTNLTSLSPDVGNMTKLQRLSIANTPIETIPESIGNLAELQRLEASSTRLMTLPASIGRLSKLVYLDLSYTPMTDLVREVANLHNLENLSLYRSKLAGDFSWFARPMMEAGSKIRVYSWGGGCMHVGGDPELEAWWDHANSGWRENCTTTG